MGAFFFTLGAKMHKVFLNIIRVKSVKIGLRANLRLNPTLKTRTIHKTLWQIRNKYHEIHNFRRYHSRRHLSD